jgi:hypothetical protein
VKAPSLNSCPPHSLLSLERSINNGGVDPNGLLSIGVVGLECCRDEETERDAGRLPLPRFWYKDGAEEAENERIRGDERDGGE